MPANPPSYNDDTRPDEEEQSLDVPTIDIYPLDDALLPLNSRIDLSADLSLDLIDIAALARDEHLLGEQDERESSPSVEIAGGHKVPLWPPGTPHHSRPYGGEQLQDSEGLSRMSQEESDIVLTARQQRALRYIARRHMHYARITRRLTVVDSEPNGKRLPIAQENERTVGAQLIAPNPHQPNDKSVDIRRGENGVERGEGPLWSPVAGGRFDDLRTDSTSYAGHTVPQTASIKGPPHPSQPPSPLQTPETTSSVDADWARLIAPVGRGGTKVGASIPDSPAVSVPEEKMGTVSDHNGMGTAGGHKGMGTESDHNGNSTTGDHKGIGNRKDIGTAGGHKGPLPAPPNSRAYGNDTPLPVPHKIASPIPPPMPPLLPKAPEMGLVIGHFPRKSLLAQTRAVRHRRIMLRHFSRKHLRQARVVERRARRRLWINIACVVLSFLLVLVSLGSAAAIYGSNYVNSTLSTFGSKILTLRDLLPLDNLKVYDSKGVLIAQLTDEGIHTTVSLNQVAPSLKNATVATEDKNFWLNEGVDIQGILRAAWINLENGRVIEGGSTITQQLIKNLIVGNDPSFSRKLQEIILAPQLNTRYTKSDILEMYLNSIYYGHQAYGIDAAAGIYFGLEDQPGKPAAMQLDLAQSAMLAGIPSNPSAYDPLQHPEEAFKRFESVLGLMVDQGYITQAQALNALREAHSPHFFKSAASLQDRAPHFAEFVYTQLEQQFHLTRKKLSRSGMMVYTTLHIGLQDKIQKIAQQHIAELRDAHHLTNAAEVLIDFHSGAIISLLGSIDYNDASIDGQFDVATAYRQPGSSFKPYVYVTAFAQGASPAQAIDDTQTTFPVPDSSPPTFTPSNYDLRFHGHMTLRCALQNSLNVPGVKVLNHVGINAAMQTAYNMGITSYQGTPGLSLVLGGLGIRLIDHTSAMGVFANGGVRVPYYAINKIVSGNTGKVLYHHQLNPGKQVISPQLAYMMTSVLSDNASRIPEFYDCNVLQLYSNSQQDCWNGDRGVVRPAATKTGTTNDFRDNWTVGYTTDYVMGVWAGNDDNTPMINVTGVQGAAPIWHDSMLVAEQGHPIQNFVNPGGLVRATVTYPDGVEATDWFLPGTVPTFAPPTPTPTAPVTGTPTPTGDNGTPTPTATAIPATPTPTPNTGAGFLSQSAIPSYCPSSYSFAFPPPSNNVLSPTPGWW